MQVMQNKIVAHYQDGRVVKGRTANFLPTKETFHVTPEDQPTATGLEIRLKALKAVFFVKDLVGNKEYDDKKEFDPAKPLVGRKIRVRFRDKEVLVGTTQGYKPDRVGFFLIPADPKSNIERCFVVAAAAEEISFL